MLQLLSQILNTKETVYYIHEDFTFMEMNEEKMLWRSKVYDEHNLKLLQMITIGQGYVF